MNLYNPSGKLISIVKIKSDLEMLQYVLETTAFLPQDVDLKERLSYIKEGRTEIKMCPYCENRCSISSQKYKLLDTCSSQICRNKWNSDQVSKVFSNYDFTKRNSKIKETCRKKYGVDNYNQLPEAWEKKKKTLTKHYGSLKNAEVERAKKRKALYKSLGITNNSSAHISKEAQEIMQDRDKFIALAKEHTVYEIMQILGISHSMVNKLCHQHNFICGYKHENVPLTTERPIEEYLKSRKIDFVMHSRSIIKPNELDFYLPDYRIAIEVNGCRWHTEAKGKDRHYNKYKLCKELNIDLLNIWDTDIKDKEGCEEFLDLILLPYNTDTFKIKIGANNDYHITDGKITSKVEFVEVKPKHYKMIVDKYLYCLSEFYKEVLNDFIQNNQVKEVISYQQIDKVFDKFYKNIGFELDAYKEDYFISQLGDKCYTCGINKWKLII